MANSNQALGYDSVISALNAHGAKTMSGSDDDLLAGVIAFSDETDRGAVILAATAFEDELKRRLLEKFVPLNSRERSDLFDFDRPLGSFSSKIRIAHAIGILDKRMKRIAEVVRVARNACAHSGQAISFRHPVLMNALYFMVQELGYHGDGLNLKTERRRDWPRFIFLLVIGVLTESIEGGKLEAEPFGANSLAETFAIYKAVKSGWRPEEQPKQSNSEDHQNGNET